LKGKHLFVFDEVEENPSTGTIDIGAQRCRDHRCDLVVALGGGSVLDAAKAISFLQKNHGSIETYILSKPSIVSKGLPVITIPTTSGTGSEVTPYSVLTYTPKKAKPAIFFQELFPEVALVDPELSLSMPPSVAASTGLDALCQAIEGFWSRRANSFTRCLSAKGIVLAIRNLEDAWRTKDKESISNMSLASLITGIQMSHVGNTAIHSLSYPFTVDFHIPHGFACIMFLPSFLRFNCEEIEDPFHDVLSALKIPSISALAKRIEEMMQNVGAPMRLSDYGIPAECIPEMVKRGITPSTEMNPRNISEEQIVKLCKDLV
jgi:alcohol dehydrogenase